MGQLFTQEEKILRGTYRRRFSYEARPRYLSCRKILTKEPNIDFSDIYSLRAAEDFTP